MLSLMAWEGSTRRRRLPAGWHTRIRPAILKRDGHRCTWTLDDGSRCTWSDPTGHTLEVDHIVTGDNHTPSNLRVLCGRGSPDDHHQVKTIADRQAARPSRLRPTKPHPGVIDPA